jgi:hypothetical protein
METSTVTYYESKKIYDYCEWLRKKIEVSTIVNFQPLSFFGKGSNFD